MELPRLILPRLRLLSPGNSRILHSRYRGLTAIEVLVSLLIISTLSLFVLQVLEHSRKIQLEINQVDTAIQISRDVIEMLRVEKDWRKVDANLEDLKKYDTEFHVQLIPRDTPATGLVGLELTISWVGPRRLEQMVFTTTSVDFEVDG